MTHVWYKQNIWKGKSISQFSFETFAWWHSNILRVINHEIWHGSVNIALHFSINNKENASVVPNIPNPISMVGRICDIGSQFACWFLDLCHLKTKHMSCLTPTTSAIYETSPTFPIRYVYSLADPWAAIFSDLTFDLNLPRIKPTSELMWVFWYPS